MIFRSPKTLVIASIVIISTLTITVVAHAQTLNRQLEIGMSGPDVFALQTFLAQDKTLYPQGLTTSYFGFLTKAAVANFQGRNGLPSVGRVGPMTLPIINKQMAVKVVTQPQPQSIAPVATIGASTLVVTPVPLLSGGITKANASVPVAYLQVTNTGKDNVELKGFWVKQNGSAAAGAIANLSTIDDRDNLVGRSIATPFKENLAFAPANIFIAPEQTRLFTIRANLTGNIQTEVGRQLMIDVTSIDSTAPIKGTFPIRGTTWTIN